MQATPSGVATADAWRLRRSLSEGVIEIYSLADHRISMITVKDWNELEDVTWRSSGKGLFASTHRGQNSILPCIDLQGRVFVLWERLHA
jgi:hypothetical protein